MPDLKPRPWYGMPGYAKDGPVLVFFRVDDYMTFGLTEKANFTIKDGAPDQLMPCAWFFTELGRRDRGQDRGHRAGGYELRALSSGLV